MTEHEGYDAIPPPGITDRVGRLLAAPVNLDSDGPMRGEVEKSSGLSDACCLERPDKKETQGCPVSHGIGQPVRWTTLAALSVGPVPPRQEVSLCRDTDCDVVYFGSRGLELRTKDVRTIPGFKRGSDGLSCYCFLHAREAIEREVRSLGTSSTLESIRTQVAKKNCACEVRNPTGKCCLKDIQRIVEETTKKGAA